MHDAPVVLITGASQGIGRAAAERLASAGCQVFGTSRRPAQAQPLAGVTFLPLDLQSPTSIQACVEAVLRKAGRLDVLVNNAGLIGPAAASEELNLEHIRQVFETNFFGQIAMTNAVLPVFRRQRQGKIINISSAGGQIAAPPFFTVYTASKHALEAYSEGLYYEVRPFNIRVSMIEPGYTCTTVGEHIDPPDFPIADYASVRQRVEQLDRAALAYGSPPKAVAEAIWRAVRQANPPLRIPVGADSQAILLARRLLPAPLFAWLIKWMYLDWRPARSGPRPAQVPTLEELGIRRYLFHVATLRNVLWAAVGLLLGAVGALIGWCLNKSARAD